MFISAQRVFLKEFARTNYQILGQPLSIPIDMLKDVQYLLNVALTSTRGNKSFKILTNLFILYNLFPN